MARVKTLKPTDYSTARLIWDGMSVEDRLQAASYFRRHQRSHWYKKYAVNFGVSEDMSWAMNYLVQDGELTTEVGDSGKLTTKPAEDEPIEELIARRVATFERKYAHKCTHRKHVILLKDNLPIGLTNFGDPHLDADGCDWPMLQAWMKVTRDTEGMYGGNLGDTTNNWVGRLQALYKDQQTTEHEMFRLARWFVVEYGIEWAYIQLGNHDLWNRGSYLFKEMWHDAIIHVLEKFETNIVFRWPDGNEMEICVRHNFKGQSMWHPVHGALKRAQLRPGACLYVQGHLHSGAYLKAQSSIDSMPYIAATVRGFKKIDSYAEEKDFAHEENYEAMCTILDPWAAPTERIRVYGDPEEAAYQLTDLRRRRMAA